MPAACSAVLLLASCGLTDSESEPGETAVGEARALEEAAEMLDSRPPPEDSPPADEQAAQPTGE